MQQSKCRLCQAKEQLAAASHLADVLHESLAHATERRDVLAEARCNVALKRAWPDVIFWEDRVKYYDQDGCSCAASL